MNELYSSWPIPTCPNIYGLHAFVVKDWLFDKAFETDRRAPRNCMSENCFFGLIVQPKVSLSLLAGLFFAFLVHRIARLFVLFVDYHPHVWPMQSPCSS